MMMIHTENLTKNYGEGRGIIGLNMDVPKNSIFGFVGPNGSGKSTTIKMLCGLALPDDGHAVINGIEVIPKNHIKIKKTVGYLPDEFGVYQQMTVWEYLDFFGAAYKISPGKRKKRIHEVLEITDGMHMLDYQVASLSRGMHQKVGIAKTMLHDPELLILDEPANGLDPHARIDMRDTILRLKDMGKTIMLSSHILPELGAICDLVAIIEKAELRVTGTVAEITESLQENLVLELQVDSNTDDVMKLLGEFENVSGVKNSRNEFKIDFVGSRNQIADLNCHLVKAGIRVLSLKESEVDLENVFLTLTGQDGSELRGKASDRVANKKKKKIATHDAAVELEGKVGDYLRKDAD
jgi:ABC-2 type transport system ATP-binding protein